MTDMELRENLKKFRMKKNPKAPFQVFPDESLDELLAKKPKSIASLTGLKGFPKDGARITKYGQDIVDFFKNGGKISNMESF